MGPADKQSLPRKPGCSGAFYTQTTLTRFSIARPIEFHLNAVPLVFCGALWENSLAKAEILAHVFSLDDFGEEFPQRQWHTTLAKGCSWIPVQGWIRQLCWISLFSILIPHTSRKFYAQISCWKVTSRLHANKTREIENDMSIWMFDKFDVLFIAQKFALPSLLAFPKPISHGTRIFLLQKVKKIEPVKGAIIESMKHHGQGVYSGTFSGKYFEYLSFCCADWSGQQVFGRIGVSNCAHLIVFVVPLQFLRHKVLTLQTHCVRVACSFNMWCSLNTSPTLLTRHVIQTKQKVDRRYAHAKHHTVMIKIWYLLG